MSENGPMWLTRSDDVLAHLYFAAAEIGSATMELGALKIPGSLSFPNSEQGSFSFFSHGEVKLDAVTLEPGAVVRLSYSQGESTYSFISEVSEITSQQTRKRWRIIFPKAIERNEQRLVRRHRVMGRPGFQASVDRLGDRERLPLYDIAAAGLSLVVKAANNLKVGEEFSATIFVPGCEPLASRIELRNLRPMPGEKQRKLAGCRFTGLSDTDREALCSVLAQLE
jgi:hypothetical protein